MLKFATAAHTPGKGGRGFWNSCRPWKNGVKDQGAGHRFPGCGHRYPGERSGTGQRKRWQADCIRKGAVTHANRQRSDPMKAGQGHPLLIMAGPCVLEGYERSLAIGKRAKAICEKLGLPYVFKASSTRQPLFLESFRGPESGRRAEDPWPRSKRPAGAPSSAMCTKPGRWKKAAEVLDIIQIPAFLCRQRTCWWKPPSGRVVNVKKGQFLAPGRYEECGPQDHWLRLPPAHAH